MPLVRALFVTVRSGSAGSQSSAPASQSASNVEERVDSLVSLAAAVMVVTAELAGGALASGQMLKAERQPEAAEDMPAAGASVGRSFVVAASADRPVSPLQPRTRLARASQFGTWSGAHHPPEHLA